MPDGSGCEESQKMELPREGKESCTKIRHSYAVNAALSSFSPRANRNFMRNAVSQTRRSVVRLAVTQEKTHNVPNAKCLRLFVIVVVAKQKFRSSRATAARFIAANASRKCAVSSRIKRRVPVSICVFGGRLPYAKSNHKRYHHRRYS